MFADIWFFSTNCSCCYFFFFFSFVYSCAMDVKTFLHNYVHHLFYFLYFMNQNEHYSSWRRHRCVLSVKFNERWAKMVFEIIHIEVFSVFQLLTYYVCYLFSYDFIAVVLLLLLHLLLHFSFYFLLFHSQFTHEYFFYWKPQKCTVEWYIFFFVFDGACPFSFFFFFFFNCQLRNNIATYKWK